MSTKKVTGAKIIDSSYNADGQRVYKKVGAAVPEFYLKDGNRTVAVLNGDGSINYWNMFGNDLIGKMSPSGEKLYYLKDNSRLKPAGTSLASTRTVVNSVGTVVESHNYYPFGLLLPVRDYQYGSATKEKFTGNPDKSAPLPAGQIPKGTGGMKSSTISRYGAQDGWRKATWKARFVRSG